MSKLVTFRSDIARSRSPVAPRTTSADEPLVVEDLHRLVDAILVFRKRSPARAEAHALEQPRLGHVGDVEERDSEARLASVIVDEAEAYVTTETGDVYACPQSGCGASPRLLATGQPTILGIAVDATALYWAASGNGTIARLAK
jgi:hypothetical protein